MSQQHKQVKNGTYVGNGPHITFLQDFEEWQRMCVYIKTKGRAAGVNHWFDIQT